VVKLKKNGSRVVFASTRSSRTRSVATARKWQDTELVRRDVVTDPEDQGVALDEK
jgi:hypothetical protein